MEQPAITVSGLQKSYGDTAVLRGLTFSVSKGEIFALLGRKRRGKDHNPGVHGGPAQIRRGVYPH